MVKAMMLKVKGSCIKPIQVMRRLKLIFEPDKDLEEFLMGNISLNNILAAKLKKRLKKINHRVCPC